MSHEELRKENNCLNCNAVVNGRYCSVCGQENKEPFETVGHLIQHTFNDFTHFDGKFFRTLKYLITRPGYLTRQYQDGKREAFLNPVRMYLFSSALFFFLFFTFFSFDKGVVFKSNGIIVQDTAITNQMSDSVFREYAGVVMPEGSELSREEYAKFQARPIKDNFIINGRKITTKGNYDSGIANGTIKDNWITRKLVYKALELNSKYGYDQGAILKALFGNFLHSLPQVLFFSLPLLAIFLKLLYLRRKEFYYVSHSIFVIHFFIFVYTILLVLLSVYKIKDAGVPYLDALIAIIYGCIFFYLYKAMRNFYGQSRAKTLLKYFLFLLWIFFILSILSLVFLFISFFKS